MSKPKKPRNKRYVPRPVSTGGGLTAIVNIHQRGAEASPLNAEQLADLGLAYWLSLEQLRTGDASEEAWSCMVCALNVGLVLAELGVGAEYEEDLVLALDGAFRAKVRSAKTGTFRLDGEAMRDIEHGLSVHDAQMEAATRAQVTEAMRTVRKRIDQGNVYEVAA